MTTFRTGSSITNTFKLVLASEGESQSEMMIRKTLEGYRRQGWKFAPVDLTRTSQVQSRCLVKAHFPLKSYLHHYREFHTRAKLAAIREQSEKRRFSVMDIDSMFYFSILGLFIYMVSIVNLLTSNWLKRILFLPFYHLMKFYNDDLLPNIYANQRL